MKNFVIIALAGSILASCGKDSQLSIQARPEAATLVDLSCARSPRIINMESIRATPVSDGIAPRRTVGDMATGEEAWISSLYQFGEKLYVNPAMPIYGSRYKGVHGAPILHDQFPSETRIKKVQGGYLVDCVNISEVTNWDMEDGFDVGPYRDSPVIGTYSQKGVEK